MAQYDISKKKYVDRNNKLFDVVLLGGEANTSDLSSLLDNKSYNKDAWGRNKSVLDFSLFSATWTFGVPTRVWEERRADYSGVEPVFTFGDISNVTSLDGLLNVPSGTTANNSNSCISKLHSSYQPNKGQLFSTSIICPNSNASVTRRWGLNDSTNGLYFELEGDGSDWELYIVRKSLGIEKSKIPLRSLLPEDFDPSKGHIYDIQYQWRGVGNIFVYIDLILINVEVNLGTLEELSIKDSSLPVYFESVCKVDGIEESLLVGCVDVSTEGGKIEHTLFGSYDTGDNLLTLGSAGTSTAIMAVRIPRKVNKNGSVIYNSRGLIPNRLTTWTRDEAKTKVHLIRDYSAPNLEGLIWDAQPDSNVEVLVGGDASPLDVAFQLDKPKSLELFGEWADIDLKNEITNPGESEVVLTPGDIMIVSVLPINTNVKTSGTLYYSEQL